MRCAIAPRMLPSPTRHNSYIQAAVEQFGGVDILLANAGIEGEVKPITDYAIDTFDQVMAVNVRGVWLGLKYAAPEIARRGGGSIVITSSVAGVRGAAGVSAYIASKHAVIGLMRTAALEMAEQENSGQYGQSGSGGYPDDAFPGKGL